MVNALEHRTDVSPTSYSSVYEQLLELPSKIDEPELENEVDLEQFSEDWSKFLEEETPRELKEDYPAKVNRTYLEDQYERLETLLEENLYEYAVLEFSSFFEEILKRSEMQKNPFSEEYENWLIKDCWEWRETDLKLFSNEDYQSIEDVYSLRNDFLHNNVDIDEIRRSSLPKLQEVLSIYNKLSPHEIEPQQLEQIPKSRDYDETVRRLRKADREEYLSFRLFRNLALIEEDIDFDYLDEFIPAVKYSDEKETVIEYNEKVEKVVAISPEVNWIYEDEIEDVWKALEYRKEQAHNIEPHDIAPSKDEINWQNIAKVTERLDEPVKDLIKSTKDIHIEDQNKLAQSYIVAKLSNISEVDDPETNILVDTTLPFNSRVRAKINSVVNSRATTEMISDILNIDWKNRSSSTSTSTW
jgi:hypothetical protein